MQDFPAGITGKEEVLFNAPVVVVATAAAAFTVTNVFLPSARQLLQVQMSQ